MWIEHRSINKWRENVFDMSFLLLNTKLSLYIFLFLLFWSYSWQLNMSQDKWSIYFLSSSHYSCNIFQTTNNINIYGCVKKTRIPMQSLWFYYYSFIVIVPFRWQRLWIDMHFSIRIEFESFVSWWLRYVDIEWVYTPSRSWLSLISFNTSLMISSL
jgi:hypothetical protein